MCHLARVPTNTDLLTSTEAGAILGKSGRTVSRMEARGALTAAVILPGDNGAHLYRRSDVLALAARLSQPDEARAS